MSLSSTAVFTLRLLQRGGETPAETSPHLAQPHKPISLKVPLRVEMTKMHIALQMSHVEFSSGMANGRAVAFLSGAELRVHACNPQPPKP